MLILFLFTICSSLYVRDLLVPKSGKILAEVTEWGPEWEIEFSISPIGLLSNASEYGSVFFIQQNDCITRTTYNQCRLPAVFFNQGKTSYTVQN